uniref:Uncharacterized protein n=1 Tax=Utricularia reniformis TaxID=192314 RepID=A0A1Y0B225_9LAMI|nr:hypothetical protein AEK19_MT1238 [Utricularia reniformis]ART31450.1 hypothetical protein AEK19_MT1238 [Utricularia reniformis]
MFQLVRSISHLLKQVGIRRTGELMKAKLRSGKAVVKC